MLLDTHLDWEKIKGLGAQKEADEDPGWRNSPGSEKRTQRSGKCVDTNTGRHPGTSDSKPQDR